MKKIVVIIAALLLMASFQAMACTNFKTGFFFLIFLLILLGLAIVSIWVAI